MSTWAEQITTITPMGEKLRCIIAVSPDSVRFAREDFYASRSSLLRWEDEREQLLPDLPTYGTRDIQVGDEGTLVEITSVRPEDLRAGNNRLHVRLDPHPDGVAGNSNPSIRRYTGWRGTSNNSYVDANGWRRVEQIERLRRRIGWRIVFGAAINRS